MPAGKGSLMILKIYNGVTFDAISGLRSNSMDVNNETVDITNNDSGGMQELLDGAGIQSFALSADGVFLDGAVGDEDLRANAFGNTQDQFELFFANGDKISGVFAITSYNRAGSYNGEETFSISLSSSGDITFTAA